jgi:hypothetical protein
MKKWSELSDRTVKLTIAAVGSLFGLLCILLKHLLHR